MIILKKKLVKIKDNHNYKIVAISDIHGHLDILKRLIKKVELDKDDYLIILGDFINKGPGSFETYSYIRELEKRDRTIILKGNHEFFIHIGITNKIFADRFLGYLREGHFTTVIEELLEFSDFNLHTFDNGSEFQAYINSEYDGFLNYIYELPIMAENKEFIFVHGGYNSDFDLKEEEGRFLKFDDYNRLAEIQHKKIVVGHWPTCNLRLDVHSNAPFINNEKNIISIDGGLGVKTAGELNAFIIEKKREEISYSYVQENDFRKAKIISVRDFPKEEKIYVNYPHYDFEIIKEGSLMSLCKHLNSGKEFTVFNSLIEREKGNYKLKTSYVNNFFELKIGDVVEVSLIIESCAQIKFRDEFGWVLKEQIEFIN